MPNLGDYLGQLMSEMAMARMQADLETIRLAELYAAHPLLRTFPVPHIRLSEVDLDVPVVIGALPRAAAAPSPRGGATVPALRKAFDEVLEAFLSSERVKLTAAQRERIQAGLDRLTADWRDPAETAIGVNKIADDFTSVAVNVIERAGKEPGLSPFEERLRASVRRAFLQARPNPPRIPVFVATAEVREAGPGESITRLRIKLTEQGMEWTSIEQGGIRNERLVPE